MSSSAPDTPAHKQAFTHRYFVNYPDHAPRQDDPNYADFNAYHTRTRAAARCLMGQRVGFDECRDAQGNPAPAPATGEQPGLELHHAHIEFALENAVDLQLLERDYPGVSNPSEVGAWVESAANLVWLCAWHHRGAAGVHNASASDYEAERYIRDLITGA
ncbi:MAG: hypothetical protein M0027_01050 [Candidatus Dormibacteraeota bacterium]|nr:hypothetical protein [Candidatus Dormibacteraeota bacterium]